MGFDLFAWLAGASPWWWVAFGAALGALEMATFTYVMLWIGLAAVLTGGALWLVPGMGGGTQLIVFAVLSVVATVAGRLGVRRFGGERENGLNRRSAGMIGRPARAVDAFEDGAGAVEIDGVRWPARLASGEAAAGAALVVTGAEGTLLLVAPRTAG